MVCARGTLIFLEFAVRQSRLEPYHKRLCRRRRSNEPWTEVHDLGVFKNAKAIKLLYRPRSTAVIAKPGRVFAAATETWLKRPRMSGLDEARPPSTR